MDQNPVPKHNCRLYACGSNGEGQLGLGYTSDKVLIPTPVPETPTMTLYRTLSSLHQIRCGGNHTILKTYSGSTVGAGDNRDNQLSHLSEEDAREGRCLRFSSALGGELKGGLAAAWKSTAFSITPGRGGDDDTRLTTVGRGEWGELGRPGEVVHPALAGTPVSTLYTTHPHGTVPNAPAPIEPDIPGPLIDIRAGMYHYILLTHDHSTQAPKLYGWGRSKNGQLGESFRSSRTIDTPTELPDIPFPVSRVTCGQYFTYLVSASGQHLILGDDKHGIKSKAPPHVRGWKDVGASWNAIFVLFNDGSLTAWGKSDLWELVPSGLPKIEKMAVGSDHIICSTTEDKKVISWGWAEHGNCGDVRSLEKPLVKGYVTGQWNEVEVMGVPKMVGAGYSTSFVLTELSQEEMSVVEREDQVAEERYQRQKAAWDEEHRRNRT